MKKNLISVIILALVFANFVLTAILMFSVLPQTKNANAMIEKVCSAIDLELNSGGTTGPSNIPIDQIETYKVNAGESMTMNLESSDGKTHYAVVSVSLSLNKKSDNYEKYTQEELAAKDDVICSHIIEIVGRYTQEEFNSDRETIQNEILVDMQTMFGSDYIVGVNFSQATSE